MLNCLSSSTEIDEPTAHHPRAGVVVNDTIHSADCPNGGARILDKAIADPVCSAWMSAPRSVAILIAVLVTLATTIGPTTRAEARGPDGRPGLSFGFQLFDANIRYTSGVFVPLPTYTATSVQPLTTQAWTTAARSLNRVGADGVTLILVRAQL